MQPQEWGIGAAQDFDAPRGFAQVKTNHPPRLRKLQSSYSDPVFPQGSEMGHKSLSCARALNSGCRSEQTMVTIGISAGCVLNLSPEIKLNYGAITGGYQIFIFLSVPEANRIATGCNLSYISKFND